MFFTFGGPAGFTLPAFHVVGRFGCCGLGFSSSGLRLFGLGGGGGGCRSLAYQY